MAGSVDDDRVRVGRARRRPPRSGGKTRAQTQQQPSGNAETFRVSECNTRAICSIFINNTDILCTLYLCLTVINTTVWFETDERKKWIKTGLVHATPVCRSF